MASLPTHVTTLESPAMALFTVPTSLFLFFLLFFFICSFLLVMPGVSECPGSSQTLSQECNAPFMHYGHQHGSSPAWSATPQAGAVATWWSLRGRRPLCRATLMVWTRTKLEMITRLALCPPRQGASLRRPQSLISSFYSHRHILCVF